MRSSRSAPLIAVSWSAASQIVKPFGKPISSVCSRKSFKQNEWKVPTVKSSAGPSPTSFATRARISPAALFVKVIARTFEGSMPFASMCAMRTVITRVFPVPAPASTSSGPSSVATASACSGFSPLSNDFMVRRGPYQDAGGVCRARAASTFRPRTKPARRHELEAPRAAGRNRSLRNEARVLRAALGRLPR